MSTQVEPGPRMPLGQPNPIILHDEVIAAAAEAGFIKVEPIIRNGKPTGQTKLVATNKDGFRGYLRSAAILQ